MRWFRKNGDAPRLLSLSPIRTQSNEIYLDEEFETSKPTTKHRSRLGIYYQIYLLLLLLLIIISTGNWIRHSRKNDINLYNVEESVIIVEKSNRCRNKIESGLLGISSGKSHFREKRNPLLDKVKHTRLSCFKNISNTSQIDFPSTSVTNVDKHYLHNDRNNTRAVTENDTKYDISAQPNVDRICTHENTCSSLPRKSYFAAKLRAMSEKYLNSSTNKVLSQLCKDQSDNRLYPSDNELLHIKPRSYSYGSLQSLEEFHRKERPSFFQEKDNQIVVTNENDIILPIDTEDTDSGIIVTDSTSSSMVEDYVYRYDTDTLSRNTSLDERRNSTSICLEYEKESRPSKIVSLDGKELYRKTSSNLCETNLQETGRNRENIAAAPRILSPNVKENSILVVQLVKTEASEELGIYIAQKSSEQVYIVCHIVEGGLADRYEFLILQNKN